MVTDPQVKKLLHYRQLGYSIAASAQKSGMTEKTARKYLHTGLLPSKNKIPHRWRTREDPFVDVWPEMKQQLSREPGLEAKTLFEDLQERYPGRFSEGQLRTLQRRVKAWRLEHGQSKEVYFEQNHPPGKQCQSDFTHMNSLEITLQNQPFKHLLYHFNLTYSNWEYVRICYSESFESLAEGLSHALNELGAVPEIHQTDNLSAAIQIGKSDFQKKYAELLQHFGLKGRKTNPYSGNENGDVEQSHHRFKRAVDQALLLRGSRNFDSMTDYETFLNSLLVKRNGKRQDKWFHEKQQMKPLPEGNWQSCSHVRVRVTKSSTIRVHRNVYSVNSRLIGEQVDVYLYSRHLEIWYGQKKLDTLPRLQGSRQAMINYRHVIDWLVRKPGAFENYRYQSQFFPTTHFRMAYDELCQGQRGVKTYLEILHLAAFEGESKVDQILSFLLQNACPLTLAEVKGLLQTELPALTEINVDPVNLIHYDHLFKEPLWQTQH
jgi:transposase